jgi:hypothetical protein
MNLVTRTDYHAPWWQQFTNGRVTLTCDLVFGVSVLSTEGWVPFADLDNTDKDMVRRLLDHNPTCPAHWRDIVYG